MSFYTFHGYKCIANDMCLSIKSSTLAPHSLTQNHLRSKLAFRSFAVVNHKQSALG